MMQLLIPLGLLALLSIIVLIIIYIIKPNYQQKFISSTYVWNLSLKYKKRKLPVSKLRNLLILICQILILSICALLLSKPVIAAEKQPDIVERVAIIDASASMLVSKDGSTRFDRAVNDVIALANETAEKAGIFSVIVADSSPYFLLQRAGSESIKSTVDKLNSLVEEGKCTYGSADMNGAVKLADSILLENQEAEVVLFTATNYINHAGVRIENVAEDGEWNAAITGCRAVLDQGFYNFEVDVGCYGRSEQIEVHCRVIQANGTKSFDMIKTVVFDATLREQTVVFGKDDQIFAFGQVATFESLYVHVEVDDSFSEDNQFYLYGGLKPTIKVLYASSQPNIFFNNALVVFRELMQSRWDIELKSLGAAAELPTTGYDFYIFEHRMPQVMPTDGVVFLVDPNTSPEGLGITFGEKIPALRNATLTKGMPHAITNKLNPDLITASEYRQVIKNDGFDELMYHTGMPALLVKDELLTKVAVLTINLHKSNLSLLMDFPFLIRNIYNYFIPSTFVGYSYEVGDTVELNARGTDLKLGGPDTDEYYEELPGSFTIKLPGTYTLTQTTLAEKVIEESFFAAIPAIESNITKEVDSFPSLNFVKDTGVENKDLLMYIALALIALLFVEWYLQSRENMR